MIRRLRVVAAVLLAAAAAALTFPPSTASDAGAARADGARPAVGGRRGDQQTPLGWCGVREPAAELSSAHRS